MQPRNTRFLVFMAAAFVFMMIWAVGKEWLFPTPPPDDNPDEVVVKNPDKPPEKGKEPPGPFATFGREVNERIKRAAQRAQADAERFLHPEATISLGSPDPESAFHLGVQIDPRGAGVREVILNKFSNQNADGRPAPGVFTLVPAEANGGGVPGPLGLRNNGGVAANLLYHFPRTESDHPSDELGRMLWTVVGDPKNPVTTENLEDGRLRQTVAFRAEVAGVEIVKRYTLTEREYHLGLEVQFTRKALDVKGSKRFRYQIAGARGLPIEGKRYTNIFRNALIAQVEDGVISRDYQDLRSLGLWGGGRDVTRDQKKMFRYAGVAVQYFASVVVVDDSQEEQGIIARVRPTLEKAVTRGVVKSIAPDKSSFVFTSASTDYTYEVFDPHVQDALAHFPPGARAAVTSYPNRRGREVAEAVTGEFQTQAVWEDDITVRLTSEPIELEIGQPVTHKYLLYNGPAKPSLLSMMTGDKAVPASVVTRYVDALQLNTMVDYQFSGWIGSFSHAIYWTHLVISCTNLLHWVLHFLYSWVPNYGLCIILLTVLVRGLMFPLSRRQALMAIKMQALAPELKALQAKYGEDRQGMALAQMALYKKHGINPFGTCWVLLLQMPVFMGLYYALQESIFFRLGAFWPTWIVNLAAPDMFFHWGSGIPIISEDSSYGGFLYLGPYLNVLPILAIVLMVIQQKMMSPPATDEQMEANQRVMTIMMCVMGLLFYKVAAGLCLYFVVSSLWGFAERAFLPKKGIPGNTTDAATVTAPVIVLAGTTTASTNVTPATTSTPAQQATLLTGRGRSKKGKRGRRQEEKKTSTDESMPEEQPKTTLGKLALWWKKRRQHLREWWAEVLKQAEKK